MNRTATSLFLRFIGLVLGVKDAASEYHASAGNLPESRAPCNNQSCAITAHINMHVCRSETTWVFLLELIDLSHYADALSFETGVLSPNAGTTATGMAAG